MYSAFLFNITFFFFFLVLLVQKVPAPFLQPLGARLLLSAAVRGHLMKLAAVCSLACGALSGRRLEAWGAGAIGPFALFSNRGAVPKGSSYFATSM